MKRKGEQTLRRILCELMKELTRLEAVARLAAIHMEEQGLGDEAGELWDLCMVAGDWVEEVKSWVSNLVREREGSHE